MNIFKSLFDHGYKEMKKFEKIADEIETLKEEYSKKTDVELKNKTAEFRDRLSKGETLDDILVEAFATVREVASRKLGETPFYVQLLGGIAIHYGNIAEMKTGEGKTLTTTLPAYLNALSGEGVHVITVNEYLTQRNAEWMGEIFDFLDISVGVNLRGLSYSEKREAYAKDILYSTNNEIGFDYLKDNMVVKKEEKVQRGLNFAILDEVDSMLIDEARTPLIISGGQMQSLNLYKSTDSFVKPLKKEVDYIKDETSNSVYLTDEGNEKAAKYFKIDNLYDIEHSGLVHHINQALKANFAMQKDVDYVIQEDEIIIVDPFTGRLMKGRAYSEGLHQAIEAKENVKIKEETKTIATITFQNLFRMYKKLSGMTGTAKTEEEEFRNIYNMYVIEIPTNQPLIRIDMEDLLYSTKAGKYEAIIDEIERRHKLEQPILVGTIAIETSELISKMLIKRRLKHEVLNAKNHMREAEIIKNAGLKKSITIATNMAGRGTDIKLGEGVVELGGLCVIGTERHEARRIDNQLRGRSGRQGDPGFSQFFVSLEDDLMLRFGADRIKNLMNSAGLDGKKAIRSKVFTGSMESAQKRVEGNNFDIRKQLLQYDNVMNEQREIIYKKRDRILYEESIIDMVYGSVEDYITNLINNYIVFNENYKETDKTANIDNYEEVLKFLNNKIFYRKKINKKEIIEKSPEELINYILNTIKSEYELKTKEMPIDIKNEFEKAISLNIIDTHWTEHISNMEHLREGIGLRGYANENPLQAYIKEGYEIFDNMLNKIDEQICIYLLNVEIRKQVERKEVVKPIIRTTETVVKNQKKPGRNDPCSCGSGKKYKQCCGK